MLMCQLPWQGKAADEACEKRSVAASAQGYYKRGSMGGGGAEKIRKI